MKNEGKLKTAEGHFGHDAEIIQGVITAESIGLDAGGIVYRQGKAKIFNVLESILAGDDPVRKHDALEMSKESRRLMAYKRIAEDILNNIARDVKQYVVDILGDDFQIDVQTDAGAILTGEDKAKADAEYRELEEKLR